MADTDSSQSVNTWPLVKFSFIVQIGDIEILFKEVSGLAAQTQQIEYRGAKDIYSPLKMPEVRKFGNISLKKGTFRDSKHMWELYNQVKLNKNEPKTITVSLLDETKSVAMTWKLLNAFPTKM